MAHYKGIEAADDVAQLMRHMDGVDETREALQALQGVWDMLTLLGEFSGTGVEIGSLRSAFADLSGPLLNQLARQARQRAQQQLRTKAQVSIDILVRNLFERTADIGFLATDDDLCAFHAADAAERERLQPRLRARLREYQAKYTVYDDIVLADSAGMVLLRLQDGGPTATRDALVAEALASHAPYLETYATSDMQPGAGRQLVYSCRLAGTTAASGAAVLSLHFRFADECQRIFDALRGADDWTVLTLIDADGTVIASSDAAQVPVGAPLHRASRQAGATLRFGGRHWLAAVCDAHPYQGYAGPGWRALAMVPAEHAFDDSALGASSALPAQLLQAMIDSPLLFSADLRSIPHAAEQIEVELNRAVWNGSVADARRGKSGQGSDAAYSKALLREITKTGTRTREVFTRAIGEMNHTVVSSTLEDVDARSALAIDIMDRNLYERANDCRWWALTTSFRRALEQTEIDDDTRAALTRTLRTIHGLYTVYANLVLFDRAGRVVAWSVDGPGLQAGRMLEMEWVRRALALPHTQAYAVSDFVPSEFYGGAPTYVYCAAVRGLERSQSVLGGVAIVFDSAPQFRAMLHDVLPCDAQGVLRPGNRALFVGPQGDFIACSDDGDAGHGAALDSVRTARLDLQIGPGASRTPAKVIELDGKLYGIGASRSVGYREYKGPQDAYRHDVVAVVMRLLSDEPPTTGLPATAMSAQRMAPARGSQRQGAQVELATFSIAGQWFGLRTADVREAVGLQRILPMPGAAAYLRGSAVVRGEPIAVVDLGDLLRPPGVPRVPASSLQVVVVQPSDERRAFGILVDALGHTEDVPAASLESIGNVTASPDSLIDHVVRPTPGRAGASLLMVLSLGRLSSLVAPASRQIAITPETIDA